MRDEEIFGVTIGATVGAMIVLSILIGGATALPFGIGVFFSLALAFLGQGLLTIPATPPSVGLVTFLGRRTELIIGEGLRFLPFRDILFGAIIIKVQKMDFDLDPQGVRTPDLATLKIKVSTTLVPDQKNLVAYLNAGGETGVKNILDDIIQDRIRGWALSPSEGPSGFMEAMGAQSEAVAVLLEAITSLLPLFPDVPSATLLRFFSSPPLPPSVYEAGMWGRDWVGLRDKLSLLSSDERAALERSVAERRELIRAARSGSCGATIPSLGVVVKRLTLGEMTASGVVVTAAEKVMKEVEEQKSEAIELAHVLRELKKLMDDLGVSAEEARRLAQAERGKDTKITSEHLISVSPETLKLLRYLGEIFANSIGGGKKE